MRHLEETRLDQTSNVQRSCHLAPEFTSKDTAVWYLFNKRQQSLSNGRSCRNRAAG
jgi:phenylalanine-4-hydroxylase